jgi:hypothetical protein
MHETAERVLRHGSPPPGRRASGLPQARGGGRRRDACPALLDRLATSFGRGVLPGCRPRPPPPWWWSVTTTAFPAGSGRGCLEWWSSAQSSPTSSNTPLSQLSTGVTQQQAGATSDLMIKCSRRQGGHDIPSAVLLPRLLLDGAQDEHVASVAVSTRIGRDAPHVRRHHGHEPCSTAPDTRRSVPPLVGRCSR